MSTFNVEDFPRDYRFKMVRAYPVISGVSDVYEATHDDIDKGFANCLAARNLARTHSLFLRALVGDETPGTGDGA